MIFYQNVWNSTLLLQFRFAARAMPEAQNIYGFAVRKYFVNDAAGTVNHLTSG